MIRSTLGIILCLTACGSLLPHEKPSGRAAPGFLSSYNNLRPDQTRPDVLVWRLDSADFASYDSVLVEMPLLRRRADDSLPSPVECAALCTQLQGAVQSALSPHWKLIHELPSDAQSRSQVLRVKVAVTSALHDNGDLPPNGQWQLWTDHPRNFAFECEVLDGSNARPLAKLVSFDRTHLIQHTQITPWSDIQPVFPAWSADVEWLIRPRKPPA